MCLCFLLIHVFFANICYLTQWFVSSRFVRTFPPSSMAVLFPFITFFANLLWNIVLSIIRGKNATTTQASFQPKINAIKRAVTMVQTDCMSVASCCPVAYNITIK